MSNGANFGVINSSILAFGKHDAIGFIDIANGHVTYRHVIDEIVMDRGICGISCISGNSNESIYAIGDISTPPRIVLFSSTKGCISQLQSRQFQF